MRGAWIIRRCPVVLAFIAASGPALAGVQDWQLSELSTSVGGDTAVRYVELANPAGGCLFPTSRLIVYGPDGTALDSQPLVSATRCFAAGSYFLAATSAAASYYGVGTDLAMAPALPTIAGQLCFVSSATHYDCVRWGPLTDPRVDFFGPGDTTSAVAPAAGDALARTQTTHVVVDDWSAATPTPRMPNDGSSWFPPDAGPVPDAAPPPPDARPAPDAAFAADASPPADADPQRYLDVDPAGGALCSCTGDGAPAGGAVTLLLLAWAVARASRARG